MRNSNIQRTKIIILLPTHNSIPPSPHPHPQHANNINIHISSLFVKPQHSLTTHQRLWDHKSMWLFRRSWQQRTSTRQHPGESACGLWGGTLPCHAQRHGGRTLRSAGLRRTTSPQAPVGMLLHTHTHTRSQSKCSLAITVLHTDTKETSASNATGKESNSV